MTRKHGVFMKFIALLITFLFSQSSFAHVKWFSDYSFQQPPLELSDLNTPYFWGLLVLSLISLPIFTWIDKWGEKSAWYQRFNAFLDQYADDGPLIMRISMGAVLLMSWQGDSVVAPEISISHPFWGWFQLILGLLLLFPKTTPITGLGVVFLWILGIADNGLFHMLDYVVYPAVGLYLIFSYAKNPRIKNLDLPVLYSGLGFSLCWVAFEKMIYPYWGLEVLASQPALTMGLPHDFFLIACAFIEFCLGYLLIICLLQRPLAAVITIVFFITTSFFGKTEVVGHTILHGALLVFIVKGPGHHYQAPIRFHKKLWMRNVFAIVNFLILFAVMIVPYTKMASKVHAEALEKYSLNQHEKYEIPVDVPRPEIVIHPMLDSKGGYNLHLSVKNFKFAPERVNSEDSAHEGHGHIYLNGKKLGRVYGEWVHLSLPTGKNEVKVTLNTNTHKDLYYDGSPVEAIIEIEESRDVKLEHAH